MAIMKQVEKKKIARQASSVFLSFESTQENVGEEGAKLFVMLYGGKTTDRLNELRYSRYMNMAAKSSKIRPEALPPTERAAHFHSLRAYYQLQDWNTLRKNNLNPENWGWKVEGGSYVPIMTDEPPAPNDILNVIRCNCKVS